MFTCKNITGHYICPRKLYFVPGQLSLSWDMFRDTRKTPARHLQILGQNDVPSVTLGTEFCPKTLCKTQFVPGQINVSCNGCRPPQDTPQDILLCLVKVVIFLVLCLSRDKYDGGFKDEGITGSIKWEIARRSRPYNCGTRRCNLCTSEKLAILLADSNTLLNKRSEIIAYCRHRNKYKCGEKKKTRTQPSQTL